MKRLTLLPLVLLSCHFSFSQSVGIGTSSPNASSQLEVSSSLKGILIPRMTTSAINTITNPAKGLMVYDSIKNQLMVNIGTAASKNWQTIVFNSGWNLTGNSSIDPSNQFIGTTDNQALRFRVSNIWAGELHPSTGNIFLGLRAGQTNTGGYSNIAFGTDALKLNVDRSNLVAIGDSTLFNNSTGATQSFQGLWNTAIGSKALYSNRIGYGNTAVGYKALFLNVGENVFEGSDNTAVGYDALFSNVTGSNNIAIGAGSLDGNTAGSANIAIGTSTLSANNSSLGSYNIAIGHAALLNTTASQYNTALGYEAGISFDHGYNNTFVGGFANSNSAGYYNCVAIGKSATCTDVSQARIGNSSTSSIGGYVGWSNISDGRYKKDVSENGVKGLDFILRLRPVIYHLDVSAISKKLDEGRGREMDGSSLKAISEKEKILYSGFVAQEVEKAALECEYDFSGIDKPKNADDLYGLRYAEFVVPLVKGMQEQQQMIDTMKRRIDVLEEQNKLLKQLLGK